MKEQLLQPEFNGETIDQYLIRIGVILSKSPDEHDIASIRITNNMTIYGFKLEKDYINFKLFLVTNKVEYADLDFSIGARYIYHVAIHKGELPKPTSSELTGYTVETLADVIKLIQDAKNITVKSHDYQTSAKLRDIEKYFIEKQDKDNNRRI